MATDMTVANTILQQLGGRKFIAMTGSKNFTGTDDALIFKIGSGALKRISHVRITLVPSDTYKIEFLKIVKYEVKTVEVHEMVYVDNLTSVFESVTGFYTHL